MALLYSFPKIIEELRSPTNNDSVEYGILKGNIWIDASTENRTAYICISNTPGQAIWRQIAFDVTQSSLNISGGKLSLEGDEETPNPFNYYGTDANSNKGWFSLGSVAGEQLEIISSSSNLYRLLLHDSPYTRCNYNLFAEEQKEYWSGISPTYVEDLFTYNVEENTILETGNVIEVGSHTESFYFYIETTVPYVAEYSTNGMDWVEFFPTADQLTDMPRVELGDSYTELYIRVTFKSNGKVLSYGCLYSEEKGAYYFFSEETFDVHYHYEIDSASMYQSFDKLYQPFTTQGGRHSEFFDIEGNKYLTIANYSNDSTYMVDSDVYKWNVTTKQFDIYQSLPTTGCTSINHFTKDSENYIFVNNSESPYSKLYKWDTTVTTGANFKEYQSFISPDTSYSSNNFTIDGDDYLIITNYGTSSDYHKSADLYKWDDSYVVSATITGGYVLQQNIPTSGCMNVSEFNINGVDYLFVNQYMNNQNTPMDSKLYKWDSTYVTGILTTGGFIEYSSLGLSAGNGNFINSEFFTIDNENYLMCVVGAFGNNDLQDVRLYKWNSSYLQFDIHQTLPATGCVSINYFEMDNKPYVILNNEKHLMNYNVYSTAYTWDYEVDKFVKIQAFNTEGNVHSTEFEIDNEHYLMINNTRNSGNYLNSVNKLDKVYINRDTITLTDSNIISASVDTNIEMYAQGLFNPPDNYFSPSPGVITLGTSTTPLSGNPEDIMFKVYHSENDNLLTFSSQRIVATQGQREFEIDTLSYMPGANEIMIYVNGVRQYPNSYTELAGNRIRFNEDLDSGDEVVVKVYKKSGKNVQQSYIVLMASENQTVFQLNTKYKLGYDNLLVYVDGIRQTPKEAYTETNTNSITFTEGLESGSNVLFVILKYSIS